MQSDLRTRSAARAASVWLAAVGVWYAWTVTGSLRHPLNAGADRLWALAWLAYAAAAIAWHLLWRRRLAAILWSGGLAVAALAMIAASGGARAVLACAWILALAAAAGSRLLRIFGAAPSGAFFEWTAVALPSGLVVLALAGLGLGLAGLLTSAWVFACLAALTILEGRALLRVARKLPEVAARTAVPPEQGLLIALCGYVGIVDLAWALAPEIQYDALNYHLAVPQSFLAHHRVVDLPYFWHSYFAQMMESLFAICLALGGQIVARLLTFALGIVAALAVAALGRALFNERVGLWAGALFYTTPMTAWLSSTTDTDLAAGLFLLSGLLAYLRWRRSREDGWLFASGWLAGGAVAVKATAAYGLTVVVIALVRDLARRCAASAVGKLETFAGYAAAASVAALAWYALRWAFTGNPFYPLASFLFPGSRAIPHGFDAAGAVGEGYGRSAWKSLLEVPFQVTFETDRFGEPFPAGAMGVALAVLFPLGLFLLLRRRPEVPLALGVCAGYLICWDLTFRGLRHGFAILPLAAVLAVGAVDALSPPGGRRSFHFGLLGAALLAQAALISVAFWNIPERIPLRRALGRETAEEFLFSALPAYPAVQYLNRIARPDEKVLGAAVANVRFYIRPRLDTVGENWELQEAVARIHGAELASKLAAMGYRYLLLAVPPSFHAGYPFLEPSFLEEHAILEYRSGDTSVYRLRP